MDEAALYLIPVPIAGGIPSDTIPEGTIRAALRLRHFIVEDTRSARRALKAFSRDFPIGECTFAELNRHTDPADVPAMLAPLREGKPMGVISEAGCPAVADPGADVVAIAQKEGFRIVPLSGPSSIILSLMASGFNGQGFAFNGYLPIAKGERERKLRDLESLCRRTRQTQIFIEAPYRNDNMMRAVIEALHPSTLVCVAADISGESQFIRTRSVAQWRKSMPQIGKHPAIFLIHTP